MTRKVTKNDSFSMFFFEVFGFWVQFQRTKLPNSNSVDNLASLDTPGGPEGVKVVELLVFEKYFS